MGMGEWLRGLLTVAPPQPQQSGSHLQLPGAATRVVHPVAALQQPAQASRSQRLVADHAVVRLSAEGRLGIAGEYYRKRDIARVVGRRKVARVGDWEAGLPLSAYLTREPSNGHDPNAVMVHVDHRGQLVHVGYLRADVAPSWQPLLTTLEEQGRIAGCPARLYRDGDSFQVVLRLAEPHEALFGNQEPRGAVLVEAEMQCALWGEQHYQAVLDRYRGERKVWATLHPATVLSGKHQGQGTIDVHIDGRKAGQLSATQGARYMSVLDRGELVACEALVYQGSESLEAQIWLPRVD